MNSSSTTHCHVSFLDFLHHNLDKRGNSMAMLFIDFGKAFDLVDLTVINKEIKLGLQPHMAALLAGFISDRLKTLLSPLHI